MIFVFEVRYAKGAFMNNTGTQQNYFVTGALGCIGAWVVRQLVQEGHGVTVFDVAGDPHRLRLIMSADQLSAVRFVSGDISDLHAVESAMRDSTHVIHLAGLQIPTCKADPSLGARVNVVGTVNVFEAAKRTGIRHVVYASSRAVYGSSDDEVSDDNAPLKPRTHYGVYKQANEGTARIYWLDDGISSIGLRPYIVYGAGRDQGMTSKPTKAMLAAAAGQAYHIPYGGSAAYLYTADAARLFVEAARNPQLHTAGADVFDIDGTVATMPQIIAAITAALPDAQVTFDDTPLPYPAATDDTPLQRIIPGLQFTPVEYAVRETIDLFRAAISEQRVDVLRALA
jgi:UDP-glucuronate 4-epimerase